MEINDFTGAGKAFEVLGKLVGDWVGHIWYKKMAEAKLSEAKNAKNFIESNKNLEIVFKNGDYEIKNKGQSSESSELVSRTINRLCQNEQFKQINIENVIFKAVKQLEYEQNISDEPPNFDKINRIIDNSSNISDDEIQNLWAKILAGEIKKPNSYSLRTLNVLKDIDINDAELIIKFANLSININDKYFLLDIFRNNFLINQYNYKISYGELLLMREIGLIAENKVSLSLSYDKDKDKDNDKDSDNYLNYILIGDFLIVQFVPKINENIHIEAIKFTKIGVDIIKLIDKKINFEYVSHVVSNLKVENAEYEFFKINKENDDGTYSTVKYEPD